MRDRQLEVILRAQSDGRWRVWEVWERSVVSRLLSVYNASLLNVRSLRPDVPEAICELSRPHARRRGTKFAISHASRMRVVDAFRSDRSSNVPILVRTRRQKHKIYLLARHTQLASFEVAL